MKKILQKDAPVLREIAQDIPLETITSPKIKTVINDMKEALASQDDGVAIAGPQIGYALRIFIVSKKVAGIIHEGKTGVAPLPQEGTERDLVFINPIIKKISKEKKLVEEGCLSVRYLYGKVSRSNKVTVQAYDENGKKFERGGTGLLAQIFQHETDHLNGILFIDKAKHLEEILPEELNAKNS